MSTQQKQRARVLMLAFHCSPNHGSEWANGWNRALNCAKHFDTWVICQGDDQMLEVQRFLESHGPIRGLHFEFVSQPGCQEHPVHVYGRRWLAYRRWHQQAFRVAERLHATHCFSLIHQVTNCAFREPGQLWKLDVPFIWGPVGGMHNVPWRFLLEAGITQGILEAVRNLGNELQLNWSPRGRAAMSRASAVLAANSTARQQIRRVYGVDSIEMLDVGIAEIAPARQNVNPADGPLRLLWSGQFVPRKALSLLLKALAQLPADVDFHLRVIGGGRLERRWRRLATSLGIADRIEWLGWLSHSNSLKQYEWADVFAFTSLRDNSGTVVLEALANGLPVICLDHQGSRDIVTEDCGLKIPVRSPGKVIDDICVALVRLGRDAALRTSMGRSARERARYYLWSRLGEQMTGVYCQVLGISPEKAKAAEALTVGAQASHEGRSIRPRWTAEPSQQLAHNDELRHVQSVPERVTTFPRNRFRDAMTWGAQRAAVGLHSLLGGRRESGFGILMYHRVADWPDGVPTPTSNVAPDHLHRQIAGLLARGYEAWPLRRMLDWAAASRPIPKNAFAVTFDDGYENNLLAAVPVLEELSVPATIFLATGFLDQEQPFPFDNWSSAGSQQVPPSSWRPLSTRQCHELMSHELIELGAHTHWHGAFADNVSDFRRDLAKSVEVLERRFGIHRPTFSFPFGVCNPQLIAAARQEGVACALTAKSESIRNGSDPFGWGRYSADDRDTVATLVAKLEGWYTPVAHVLRFCKRPLAAIAPEAIGELVTLPKPCFAPSDDRYEPPRELATRSRVDEFCEQML